MLLLLVNGPEDDIGVAFYNRDTRDGREKQKKA